MYGHRVRRTPYAVAAGALWAALTVLTVVAAASAAPLAPGASHPSHAVLTYATRYKGRTFWVTRLPRCEHVQAVITHEPSGETRSRAKARMGGVAVLTGTFHHPRTLSLADFLQRDGTIECSATTGRWFLAIRNDGSLDITRDYSSYKGRQGVSAMALGQRLVPLSRDGFSIAFMNRVTDRMALGLTATHIYLVTAKTDLWRLSAFMQSKLHVTTAINSDGGHVVWGRAPVHLVFRWRNVPAVLEAAKTGGPDGIAAKAAPASLASNRGEAPGVPAKGTAG